MNTSPRRKLDLANAEAYELQKIIEEYAPVHPELREAMEDLADLISESGRFSMEHAVQEMRKHIEIVKTLASNNALRYLNSAQMELSRSGYGSKVTVSKASVRPHLVAIGLVLAFFLSVYLYFR